MHRADYGKSLTEILTDTYPTRPSLCGPWLKAGELCLLFAPRGIGKTFLALELAHAIASGRDFLKWPIPTPRSVVLFDGEMGQRLLASRLGVIDLCSSAPCLGKMLHIASYEHFPEERMPNLADPNEQLVYNTVIGNAELIIIDNLLTCSNPVNKWDDDLAVWKRIHQWALYHKNKGRTILFIHHASKAGTQYGTVHKENTVDTVVSIRKSRTNPDDLKGLEVEWHFEKSRNFYGADAEPLWIRYSTTPEGSTWEHRPLTAAIDDQVKEMHALGMKPREIAEITGVSAIRIAKIITAVPEEKQWNL